VRRIRLDPRTLRYQRRYTGAALGFAAIAAAAPIVAGGASLWFRWIAAVVTIAGTLGACRFRITLHLPIGTALAAAALLPDDASIDPAIVAAITATSMLLCAEAVAVARRLVTAATVPSVGADSRALATVAGGAVIAVLCVGALAPLERFGVRVLVVGLAVVMVAVVVVVRGSLPIERDAAG